MNETKFLELMKDILDNDNISMASKLSEIEEWDSLSIVSYIAMADTKCGKKISPEQLKNCSSIMDLYSLII